MSQPLLQVDHLSVTFRRDGTLTTPVRDVSLTVQAGERVAVVGESGCGKSLTALSLTRLSPTDRARLQGRVLFDGTDTLTLDSAALTCVRGRGIAYVFQDPSASLNPVMRVQDQIAECLPDLPRAARRAACIELLTRTGLPDPARAARAFPCELSGGQQQRVMLAMALAARPKLLVADEPTTALDVTTQRQVLDLIDALAGADGMAVLLITHNLGLVAGRMARVYVMYAGLVVESGAVTGVLSAPRHPYTRGLLAAVPMLDAPRNAPLQDIPGTVPSPDAWPAGCAFAPRCAMADARCHAEQPPIVDLADGRRTRCWHTQPCPS
ncbi:MAG TPA: ABC transporter ATP-binding protein [Kiritimatiellia bacterium]|nr:ABC transporter ATP-binding protein [Kiritimatiellia bacterium]HRU69542.1 ABC transporter ATP-binding protein [Kiritimatiellia bacterium]